VIAEAPPIAEPRKTLAEESRERRDLVSGEVTAEAKLVRFVVGPDGQAVPDLGRKLPGRGLWVAADRASVDLAAKKGLFSRAAKTKVAAPSDLADQVAQLLEKRLLDRLGLLRRTGGLALGFEQASAAIAAHRAAVMLEASDGAEDGRRKLLQVAHRVSRERPEALAPRLIGLFDSAQLGLALGLGNVIHVVILAGRAAERWTEDVERLSGFRPLLPESWREKP
jgi:uncharacterized protein